MASVCGSSLSMMAAGVPIKAPVAGIAMGLVYDEGTYVTLTDILGTEDAFGDMDFKVAGTKDSVTALQLDTKIDGLPADVLSKALHQAKEARLAILEVMAGAIDGPRDHVADAAPKIVSFEIPMDKIGEVIGPKGKVINALQQETGADIAVDDDGMVGTVTIGAKDGTAVEEARRRIATILDPPLAEVGAVYPGKVVNITKFGAFVNILPGRDGLLHISKIGQGKRVERVEDVLDLGQTVEVKVDDIDPQGKVSLSLAGAPPADASGWRQRQPGAVVERPRWSGRPGDRGRRDDRVTEAVVASGPATSPPHRRRLRSRMPSRPSWSRSSATSGPRPPPLRASSRRVGAIAVGADAAVGDRRCRSADSREGIEPVIRTETLPSGIVLATEPMADARSVCIGFWVGTGSRTRASSGPVPPISWSTSCSRARLTGRRRPSPRPSTR